ncbi:hypothetical protein DAEQUDRAFT_607137 [Daedalea quercina L-15889]|uniref:Uncharacterized protein n=1 Tax=Daedalea quercina L-15889 TaxID=1314783 RepID=A0A165LJD9_9APHY|nr:hypothetical protein DAEQUDRAFT_607137 [Daedalea quercina L-15889]
MKIAGPIHSELPGSTTSTCQSSLATVLLHSESGVALDPTDASLFEPCKEAIHAFLQGLQPSMETLVPKFMSAGHAPPS